MRPHVSVVMPVGSVDLEFEQALDAVVQQAAPFSFEVVLSVNSTSSSAWAAVESTLDSLCDERLRVVDSSDHRGAAHARNVGVRAARGGLIAFCDSDDIAEVGWLSALVAALEDHDAVSGPVSDARFLSPGQEKWRALPTVGALPTFLGVPYQLSCNLGISQSAFEAAGGFDITLTRCEDIALSWTLIARGYSLGYAADALIHYRPRPTFRSMLAQHYHYGRGMSELLVRYGLPERAEGRRARDLLRVNGERSSGRSLAGALRRASTAAGRAVGLVSEATSGSLRVPAGRAG